MAVTINQATKIISIPQADLTLVSGTLYDADTDALRLEIMGILDDESHMWMPDAHEHFTEGAVAGVTYARRLTTINSYTVQFTPDSQWSARLVGSNNDWFDIENGILIQNQVQVIPTNSAGLQTVTSGSGLSAEQADQLEELWQDKGFDASNPITVNESTGVVTVAGIIRTWAGSVIKTFTRTP